MVREETDDEDGDDGAFIESGANYYRRDRVDVNDIAQQYTRQPVEYRETKDIQDFMRSHLRFREAAYRRGKGRVERGDIESALSEAYDYYRAAWRAAEKLKPNFLQLMTFAEWFKEEEDTQYHPASEILGPAASRPRRQIQYRYLGKAAGAAAPSSASSSAAAASSSSSAAPSTPSSFSYIPPSARSLAFTASSDATDDLDMTDDDAAPATALSSSAAALANLAPPIVLDSSGRETITAAEAVLLRQPKGAGVAYSKAYPLVVTSLARAFVFVSRFATRSRAACAITLLAILC
jgi:hypothetical protein